MNRKLFSLCAVTVLLTFTFSMLLKVQIVEANETIYILADGSITGTTNIQTVDNLIYVFVADIVNQSVIVQRDSVMLDGDGHLLQGTNTGNGIDLSNRTNVTVRNTQIRAFYIGIWLNYSSDCIVSENNITMNQKGIKLDSSSNNDVSHNRVETNSGYGISLYHSNHNNLSSNIASNNDLGFWVESSTNSNISHNTVTANSDYGIKLVGTSSNSIISENEVMNQPSGIDLYDTNSSHVLANNIRDNYIGIAILSSSNNSIYHNNFFNNTYQAGSDYYSWNVWDDGYPFGGNYWSDYAARYPNASEIDASGIWDIPYDINANNTDRYPLMTQYIVPEYQLLLILPLFMMASMLAIIVYRRKLGVERLPN